MAGSHDANPSYLPPIARAVAAGRFLYFLMKMAVLAGVLWLGWHLQQPLRLTTWRVAATAGSADAAASAAGGAAADVRAALAGKHGLKELLRSANLVTAQIGRTSNTLRLATVEQRAQAAESAKKLTAALSEFETLIAATNTNLNGSEGALPTLTADLAKTGAALERIGGEGGLVAEGTKTLASAGSMVEDLRAPVKQAAENLASASAHTDGAMAHVETTTGYIEQQFAPKKVSFWLRIAEAAMGPVMSTVFSLAMPQRVTVVNKEGEKK